MDGRKPTLLGVPIDCAGRPGGTELAPAALRAAGVRERLGADDAGDAEAAIRGDERDPGSGVLALASVVATIAAVRDAVSALLAADRWPLLLAGDCTATIAACAALRDGPGARGLVYVDGHIDLYDGRTSPTGESADFPLAVVCGRGPAALREAAGAPSPIVDPGRVALLGARDREEAAGLGSLMPEELDPELLFLDVEAVRRAGPAPAAARGAEHAAAGNHGFWLHLDLDVLDEAEFPATDYLMPGGLGWAELAALLGPPLGSAHCRGMTVACLNPEKDEGGQQASRVVDLLASVGPW